MDKSAQDKKANHNGNLYKVERRCSVFRFSLYSSVQEQNMPSNLQVHTICNVRFYTKNIILLIKLRIEKLEFDGEYLVFRMKLEYISFSSYYFEESNQFRHDDVSGILDSYIYLVLVRLCLLFLNIESLLFEFKTFLDDKQTSR